MAIPHGAKQHGLKVSDADRVVRVIFRTRLGRARESGRGTGLILHRHARLSVASLSWEGTRGDLRIMPDNRHSLEALGDSAVLPTVAKLSKSQLDDVIQPGQVFW
jgi:hypothetical protein